MASHGAPLPERQPDYSTWSTSSLIARITELERQLHNQTSQYTAPPATVAAETTVSNPAPPTDAKEAPPAVAVPTKGTKKRSHSPSDDITHDRAPNRPKAPRQIDPSKYHTRFIALKFAYLGQRYNGFEHANGNVTPLPTIEEELYKALRKTRLIFPTDAPAQENFEHDGLRPTQPFSISWEGCQYSKAGRTDRGVSGFGQVIGIRVRSARPKSPTKSDQSMKSAGNTEDESLQNTALQTDEAEDSSLDDNWDDVADELPYIYMLNRVLPEDIRILAWCPHPPADFDARFSCRERRYKYFFTNPAFSPTPGPLGFTRGSIKDSVSKFREGWLDIDAMRQAAKYFEGVHDFRNFCKVDTSKQIENFERIIYHADIELVDPKTNPLGYVGQPGFKALEGHADTENLETQDTPSSNTPQVYAFTLHGSAFLWHQVRHMVAILFLIGQGLESPSLVPELLDISKNPCKPTYEMASDAPLVLWDCIFPDESTGNREDALEWIYVGDPRMAKFQSGKGDGKFGLGGVVDDLWSVWRQRKIDEILAGALLDLAVSQGDPSTIQQGGFRQPPSEKLSRGQRVFYGASQPRVGGKYIPVMQKKRTEPVEVQNAKYLANRARRQNKE